MTPNDNLMVNSLLNLSRKLSVLSQPVNGEGTTGEIIERTIHKPCMGLHCALGSVLTYTIKI